MQQCGDSTEKKLNQNLLLGLAYFLQFTDFANFKSFSQKLSGLEPPNLDQKYILKS